MIMILLGTFLVNSLPALVLFDTDASQYFVFQSFSRSFDMTLGELECSLRVSITNEHGISALSISWVLHFRSGTIGGPYGIKVSILLSYAPHAWMSSLGLYV